MAAKAQYFKVVSISDVGAAPRLELSAEIVLENRGEITAIDTEKIRVQVENACNVYATVRSGAKK